MENITVKLKRKISGNCNWVEFFFPFSNYKKPTFDCKN